MTSPARRHPATDALAHQSPRADDAAVSTPIVASVKGWAIGLGMNIALASDFVVAADDARFWAPFVDGIHPRLGGSWLIPRLVGIARAKEMILLGRKVSGKGASDWGLVHSAVPNLNSTRPPQHSLQSSPIGPPSLWASPSN